VVYVVALPLGYIVAWLIDLLRSLIHPGNRIQPPSRPLARLLDSLKDRPDQGNGPPDIIGQILTVAVVALLVAIVVGLLARAVNRRIERTTDDGVEEVREVVWSWAEIKSALLRWFADWRRRRRQSIVAAMVKLGHPASVARSRPLT